MSASGSTRIRDSRSATVEALLQASGHFGADPVERLALFEAAIVASGLDAGYGEDSDRIGVLAQNATWGPAAARRDPYTAATVFLREIRRIREEPQAPRTASGLATRVQGGTGAWRHRVARWSAGGAITRAGQENLRRWVS